MNANVDICCWPLSRLGEALASHPRDSYVLATKVGRLLHPVTAESIDSAHYKGTPPVAPRRKPG